MKPHKINRLILIFIFFILLMEGCKKKENDHAPVTPSNSTDTPSSSTVTDIDGNVYNTVTIGTQVWMIENLKVTKYRNGNIIPNVTDTTQWSGLTTGAWCYYNNDVSYNAAYGKLYNWYTVIDSRNICPVGWHIPTDAEWTILTNYLGGETVAGGKMKEAGLSHWLSPNTAADNSSGFAGLPGGARYDDGGVTFTFGYISSYGGWWSSTEGTTGGALFRYLYYDDSKAYKDAGDKEGGLSVRCIKD
jgi:uncharacterized protein (TIGR02145 family)